MKSKRKNIGKPRQYDYDEIYAEYLKQRHILLSKPGATASYREVAEKMNTPISFSQLRLIVLKKSKSPL